MLTPHLRHPDLHRATGLPRRSVRSMRPIRKTRNTLNQIPSQPAMN
jgi:hypothetical protein